MRVMHARRKCDISVTDMDITVLLPIQDLAVLAATLAL